ncbi:hypothetical protein JCM19233_1453 [Vibrio astriarenae]|nr:hypothetical protein JCM19233_1453 [Vibrio sp. C7]
MNFSVCFTSSLLPLTSRPSPISMDVTMTVSSAKQLKNYRWRGINSNGKIVSGQMLA